ncbi:MAG: hypothetical protein HY906_04520 [Deltaproteobacteria bacterium]|nr:hypothetical protein [Deltaproteobacteria bacterium]
MSDPLPAAEVPRASLVTRVLGRVVLGLILAVAVGSALYGIAGPLAWGHHGYHAGTHGNDAKHLLRNGTMVQQWDPGYDAAPGRYYLHHPILLHHYLAGAMLVLGQHVWALRAVPAFFTLLLVLLVFLVGRRAWGLGPGLMGAAVFALLPMVASFNLLPDHQHPAAFYTVAGFSLYLHWLETKERWAIALGLVAFVLVGFTDWTPYLITFFFGLYLVVRALWVRRRAELLGIVGLILAFAIPLAVHFALVKLLGAEADMQESLGQRTGGPEAKRIAELMYENQLRMYTKPVVYMTGLWLVTVVIRAPFGRLRKWHLIPICFLLAQTIYVFLFRQGVYVHIYRTYYAGIVYAFAAADLLGLLVLGLRAVGAARLWRGLPGAVAVLPALGLLALEARDSWPIYLESRDRAGSIGHQGYNPDLERLVFGRFVNDLSTPKDVVLVHSSFRARYEFHWYLERDVLPTTVLGEPLARRLAPRLGRPPPPQPPQPPSASAPPPTPPRGKLLIFSDAHATSALGTLAHRHPCYRVGQYLVVDLRREGAEYRSYKLIGERPRRALARILGGPHHRTWRLARDLADEWRVVLAQELPVEDRPPPPRPKGSDRTAWLHFGQAMAALGKTEDARAARDVLRVGLQAPQVAGPLGDGLVLDAAVWRRGSPFQVLLHAAEPPARQHALVLELRRVGPAPPPPLPRPELRPPARGTPPLLGVHLAEPPVRTPPRFERTLEPSTTGWAKERTQLERWTVQPPPGTWRGRLRLRPLDPGEPLELPAPVDVGLIDAR